MRLAAGACAILLAALAASGCGTVGVSEAGQGDVTRGKELFAEKCASCHTLADAGSKATIGPNLDDAFAQSRRDGLGETTIQTVVRTQIAYPVEEPPTGQTGMPADLVTGDDAEAVAAYVASVSGKAPAGGAGTTTGAGGGSGKKASGATVFADAGCGTCHTFATANSSGTIGPNLDDAKPSKELAVERVSKGKGAMPAFAGQLSEAEIDAVAEYVSTGGK